MGNHIETTRPSVIIPLDHIFRKNKRRLFLAQISFPFPPSLFCSLNALILLVLLGGWSCFEFDCFVSSFYELIQFLDSWILPREWFNSLLFHSRVAIMQILLNTLEGETVTLQVESYDLVETLKAKIAEIEDVPVDEQRLLFAGKLFGQCVLLILAGSRKTVGWWSHPGRLRRPAMFDIAFVPPLIGCWQETQEEGL